jgi:acyl carrier protein
VNQEKGTGSLFVVGGDSLQAGRIVARVNSAFGVHIQIQALLDAATVSEMAISVTCAIVRYSGD